MKNLHYNIRINAPKEKVWQTMLDSETYTEWAKAFSPNSRFIGKWKQGAHVRFIDTFGGHRGRVVSGCLQISRRGYV